VSSRGATYTVPVSQHGIDELGLTAEEPLAAPPSPAPRRTLRRVLIAVGAVVGLAVVSVVGYIGFIGFTVGGNITQENLLPSPTAPVTAPDGSEVPTTGVGENFLLIGTDGRTPTDRGRSDVIIIVHIPEDPTDIQMIHFPRDLYVSIPGHGKNKINAAYAFGGEPLLVETLQNLLGININHVARTDFDGFKGMVDAVGGIRVYAEEASSGTGGVPIQKGWNELDGTQALDFVRERHELSQGDISRGRRQLAAMKALLLKATSRDTITNPLKIAAFADAATQNLAVDQDLTLSDMKDYALELRDIRADDVVFATAPFTGFGMDPVAGSIDIVDTQGMELLGEALRTDTMDDYLDVFQTP
jgi:LCP family protein required for cell wall assembly